MKKDEKNHPKEHHNKMDGKKGKKGGLSEEKKAAKDGAMVESTGKKQTFDDDEFPSMSFSFLQVRK